MKATRLLIRINTTAESHGRPATRCSSESSVDVPRGLPSFRGSRTFASRSISAGEVSFVAVADMIDIHKLFIHSTALVSRKFIVTAGHCVSKARLRDIIVYLGELDTQDSGLIYEPLPAEKHSVNKKYVHPRFRFRLTQPDRFDVALLKLNKPAGYKYFVLLLSTANLTLIDCSFRAHILPICLPTIPLQFIGKNGYIAGWGKISQEHGHTGTNILRTAAVPIICELLLQY